MAGYNGYSMSNNATKAYDEGRMPLSKWTKTEILEAIESYLVSYGNEAYCHKFDGLSKKELSQFLHTDGEWHHTSKFYNKTMFFSVNENAIDDFCASGEPVNFIVHLLDKNEYISKEANEKGLFFAQDKARARKMTEYEANRRVSINAEFDKKAEKEHVK